MFVSQLYIYPLKSAKGLAVDAFELTRRGPLFDRQWMAVTLQGKFLTQRQYPKMCLIETSLQNDRLQLAAPSMSSILVADSQMPSEVTVWKDTVRAKDCGDDVADWLSSYMGKPCRLVEMPADSQRLVDQDYATDGETVGFADGYPLMLVSQASLDSFNSKLDHVIGIERFRPNIVIDGCDAYAEDDWRDVQIGDIPMSLVKPCSRCIIPSIDPLTGEKQMLVNQALLKYRRRERSTYFGQNVLHRDVGTLQLGDKLRLL